MGKFEVLGWLQVRRDTGDETYYSYEEVHRCMRADGLSMSYGNLWRNMNTLWSDGLLEVQLTGTVLNKKAKFRAKEASGLQVSGVKKVHNMFRRQQEDSGRGSPKRSSAGAVREW